MKMMRYSLLIAVAGLALMLASCSDNNTNPIIQNMSEYFPTSMGSWWKYENWILDSTGTRVKLNSEDSIVVEGTTFMAGKQVIIMADYSRDTLGRMRKDTSFVAIEGSKLMFYANLIFSDGDSIPWLTMADLSSANWRIYEKSIKDSNMQVKTEYYTMMAGTEGGLLDYTIKNTNIKAQEFTINSITRTSVITPSDTTLSDQEGSEQDLYGKGIGAVYSKYMMTKNSGFPLTGYETVLIDYYIK
jgi:hypothetical protein